MANVNFTPDGKNFDYNNVSQELLEEAIYITVLNGAEGLQDIDKARQAATDVTIAEGGGYFVLPFPLSKEQQDEVNDRCKASYEALNSLTGEVLYESLHLIKVKEWFCQLSPFQLSELNSVLTVNILDNYNDYGKVTKTDVTELFVQACTYVED